MVLALCAYGVVRLTGPGGTSEAGTTPSSTPTGISSSSYWHTVAGACGRQVRLPILRPGPVKLRRPTGLHVLAGGAEPARIGVDSGHRRQLTGVPNDMHVRKFVRDGQRVFALAARCYNQGEDRSPVVLRITEGGAHRVHLDHTVDGLIGGPAGVWTVRHPDGRAHSVVLTPLGSGETIRLSKPVWFVGVTDTGIVAHPVGQSADGRLVVFDAESGKVKQRIGHGRPIAVGGDFVVWIGDCSGYGGARGACVVQRTELGSGEPHATTYTLPTRRVPYGPGALSRDGRFVAFQLSVAPDNGRYETGHPGSPTQVAVLDLAKHRLRIVPGLELAPKSHVSLAFAPSGRTLLIGVNRGRSGRLLVWRWGDDRLRRSPAELPGPLSWAPPMLVLPH